MLLGSLAPACLLGSIPPTLLMHQPTHLCRPQRACKGGKSHYTCSGTSSCFFSLYITLLHLQKHFVFYYYRIPPLWKWHPDILCFWISKSGALHPSIVSQFKEMSSQFYINAPLCFILYLLGVSLALLYSNISTTPLAISLGSRKSCHVKLFATSPI